MISDAVVASVAVRAKPFPHQQLHRDRYLLPLLKSTFVSGDRVPQKLDPRNNQFVR
ncbi:MAG: hypothetical protein KME54_10765 [Tolypothrix brevis GSE-NOS-MK-07-07A]|nr:hypothetical protein [Tolypothrix brevis GSE-NOS-MK-07-07A]